jgi:hypothetical protein
MTGSAALQAVGDPHLLALLHYRYAPAVPGAIDERREIRLKR